MDIPVNVEVFASDGLAGHSTAVIIDPASRKVTHVIVKDRSLPHREHILPIEFVMSATPDSLNLRITRADMVQLDPFRYSDYAVSDSQDERYMPHQSYWGPSMGPNTPFMGADVVTPISYDHVPPGDLVIHKGGQVNARDGYVGTVDELIVDPHDGRITHLVLGEGHLWGQREVTIPVSEIDHMEDEHVYLKIDKRAVETLSFVPEHSHTA